MKLTQPQGALIADYLREVATAFDSKLSASQRDQALSKLRTGIYRDLEEFAKDRLDDQDVQSVLDRYGPAEIQARAASPRPAQRIRSMLDRDNAVWLGVCGGLAAKLGIDSWIVRLVCGMLGLAGPVLSVLTIISLRDFSSITLGLFTLSASLTGYLVLYVCMYLASDRDAVASIRMTPISVNAGTTVAIVLALHIGTGYFTDLLRYVHSEFLRRPMPPLGQWGWIESQASSIAFWALACCVPLAVFGGLPMANQWNQSLKRAGQAGLALYGVALAFGVASMIVGATLDLVENFGGTQGLFP